MRDISTLELAGNVLCLDFANTVNSRRHEPHHDYLASYDDLLRWSQHAGAPPVQTPLAIRSAKRAVVLSQAHRLREAIYTTFSAIAGGRRPPAPGLVTISDAYRDAMAHATITYGDDDARFEITWTALDSPLWPVALSSADLLLHGDLTRIGECPGCGWLFLDTSRNGTRRWCNMATCGSRDKMARYRRSRDAVAR